MSLLTEYQFIFAGGHQDELRQKGSTTALISIMLSNPEAVMIVQNNYYAHDLANKYGIDRRRFYTAINGFMAFKGKTINGPILVDLPAIVSVLGQIATQHAGEVEKLKKEISELSNTVTTWADYQNLYAENSRHKAEIRNLQIENVELLHLDKISHSAIDGLNDTNQALRNRIHALENKAEELENMNRGTANTVLKQQNTTLQKENDELKEANAILRVTCQSIRDQLDHLIENT